MFKCHLPLARGWEANSLTSHLPPACKALCAIKTTTNRGQLSTTDILALATMKNAANCDT
jgi:hypothetical protein